MLRALIHRLRRKIVAERQKHYVDIRLPKEVCSRKSMPMRSMVCEPEEKSPAVTDIGGMKIRTDKGKVNAMERKIYCVKCRREVTMKVKKTVLFDKKAKTPTVTMSARCPKCGTAASEENIKSQIGNED